MPFGEGENRLSESRPNSVAQVFPVPLPHDL